MEPNKQGKKPKRPLRPAETILLIVIGLALVGIVWMLADSSCQKKNVPFERTGYAMGSLVQQTIYSNTGEEAALAAAVNTEITALENRISWRVEGSAVARMNANAGKSAVRIDQQTASLLEIAQTAAQRSGGAYNPTLLPLSLLWNFDHPSEPFTPPEQELVQSLLPLTDYTKLAVNPAAGTAYLEMEAMAIDLGGIGKGAACDAALRLYQESGVQGAVVAVGGSVGVYGTRPEGGAWRIGVRDPEGGRSEALGVLALESGCVSTSGIYEKGKEVGGVYYHHIVDGGTGYPAQSDLLSATVLHESGTVTDALATACVVLGKERALLLLESYGAQGVLIDKEKTVFLTAGLKDQFTLSNTAYRLAD